MSMRIKFDGRFIQEADGGVVLEFDDLQMVQLLNVDQLKVRDPDGRERRLNEHEMQDMDEALNDWTNNRLASALKGRMHHY